MEIVFISACHRGVSLYLAYLPVFVFASFMKKRGALPSSPNFLILDSGLNQWFALNIFRRSSNIGNWRRGVRETQARSPSLRSLPQVLSEMALTP